MVNVIRASANGLLTSAVNVVVAGVSSTIGGNFLSMGIVGGAGFGLVQGAIARIAYDALLPTKEKAQTAQKAQEAQNQQPKKVKTGDGDDTARMFKAEVIGAASTCVLAYVASSLGLISAPVSIPTAAVLTIAIVGTKILMGRNSQYSLENRIEQIGPSLKAGASKVQSAASAVKDALCSLPSICLGKIKSVVLTKEQIKEKDEQARVNRNQVQHNQSNAPQSIEETQE